MHLQDMDFFLLLYKNTQNPRKRSMREKGGGMHDKPLLPCKESPFLLLTSLLTHAICIMLDRIHLYIWVGM